MKSLTVSWCIDDRRQVLKLRKAPLEAHGHCVKLASRAYAAIKTLEETSVAAFYWSTNRKAWGWRPSPAISSNGFPS